MERSTQPIASSSQKPSSYQQSPLLNESNDKQQAQPYEETTLHAQSFVLALAFFFIWSPQNLMAPNLTQMAQDYNFTNQQRDLYLGAYIAIVTGVLSLPLSALLGFFADTVPSRKILFAGTVFLGGLSALLTAYSTTYSQLVFLRFCCGGFMSGSVPVAFSLLGDMFDVGDRNAASSGLTAMMGAGIVAGQVLAGMIGDSAGWKIPFLISGLMSIASSLMVLQFVKEPVRGGKEMVLQDMIAKGTKYDRQLTLKGFLHAMTKNRTNVVLMLQGFFTNIPWGVIFTFLNDYLSQEQGLSVPTSTFLVLWFGVGAAAGGILGGYCGTVVMAMRRSYLPLFMATCTLLGILPFLGLLDLNVKGNLLLGIFLAFSGGCIANLPSSNVRPILINVNPPETRGATMTAANLLINLARGFGPSLITLSQSFFGITRQSSFNFTMIVFWTMSAVLLAMLIKTLPADQDAMDAELATYAEAKIGMMGNNKGRDVNGDENMDSEQMNRLSIMLNEMQEDDPDNASIFSSIRGVVSIEDRLTSFDAAAVQESLVLVEEAFREIAELRQNKRSRLNYQEVTNANNDDRTSDRSECRDS